MHKIVKIKELKERPLTRGILITGRPREMLNKLLRRLDRLVSNVNSTISKKDTEERDNKISLISKDSKMRRIESLTC